MVDRFIRHRSFILRDGDLNSNGYQSKTENTHACLHGILCGADAEFLRRVKSHISSGSDGKQLHGNGDSYVRSDFEERGGRSHSQMR